MLSFSFLLQLLKQTRQNPDLGERHSSALDQIFSFEYLKNQVFSFKYLNNGATICICEHGTGFLADAGLDPNSGGSDIQTMDRKVRR